VTLCGAEAASLLQRLRDARPGAAFHVTAGLPAKRTLAMCDPSLLL
jgi:hypothetical protein